MAAGLGLAALALAGLATGARADGHCGENATIAATASGVPDLSDLVGLVNAVAGDPDYTETASAFLSATQDPDANVTVFAPVNAAFEALGNVTEEMEENLGEGAKVLMFHAVPGMMEEGQGYDTLLGAAKGGQLTINGDEVEGPCNSAKVAQTVEVCNSIVHVVSEGEGSP